MRSLADRFVALPRAARWAVLALVLVGAYLLGIEPAIDAAASVNDRADRREAMLRWLDRESSNPDGEVSQIRSGVERFGKVDPPGDPRQRSEQISEALTRILTAHDVREQTTTSRTVPLSTGPMIAFLQPNQILQKQVVEVTFESPPEVVARVVADLEREPCVSTVSRITMRRTEEQDRSRRGGGGMVRAGLTVEAWFVSQKPGGTR